MRKKSAWLLGLLFFVAWATTSDAKTEVYVWLWKAKIEGPNFLLGTGTVAPLTLGLALPLILWLQRDQIGRTLAILGAVGSLLFCIESAHIIVWSARLIYGGFLNAAPAFAKASINQELWSQIIRADVALVLSGLSLWLCARAAGPQQPRPLATWRDWLNWNKARVARSEDLPHLPTSKS